MTEPGELTFVEFLCVPGSFSQKKKKKRNHLLCTYYVPSTVLDPRRNGEVRQVSSSLTACVL